VAYACITVSCREYFVTSTSIPRLGQCHWRMTEETATAPGSEVTDYRDRVPNDDDCLAEIYYLCVPSLFWQSPLFSQSACQRKPWNVAILVHWLGWAHRLSELLTWMPRSATDAMMALVVILGSVSRARNRMLRWSEIIVTKSSLECQNA
jgi:hypothetical protein